MVELARVLLLAVFLAASATAEEGEVAGTVEEVADRVDDVFDELEIDTVDEAISSVYGLIIGESESQVRITISINQAGEGRARVNVRTDSPADPALEAKLLAALNP